MSLGCGILIIDADATLRATLTEQLAVGDEFVPLAVASIAAAETCLSNEDAAIEVILLADQLPDGDGRAWLERARERWTIPPVVLMLTAADQADPCCDALLKPFRLGELLFRLRRKLRQVETADDTVFVIGPYTFRPGARLLLDPARDLRIRLTEKEVGILRYLLRAGAAPVERHVLLNEVWGYSAAITTHTLETHIYRLRQKMEADPSNARLLLTETGGYRLAPDAVTLVEQDPV